MLQRVGFTVQGAEIEGILHLPDGATAGGAAVLGGRNGMGEPGAYLCEALAAAGIAALRFDHRAEDPASRLADAGGAIRLLRAHPAIPQLTAVVGHSYGAAIAALAAGRDSRLRAAVLLAPPADRPYFGTAKPVAELSRTRARVLIVSAAADTIVDPGDAGRYDAVLTQAGAVHRLVSIAGADHQFSQPAAREAMLAAVTAWLRDAFG